MHHIVIFHSFHRHVQNAAIPCHSQELLPFLSLMYFFLPPFSNNYSSIHLYFILPSISWSLNLIVSKFIYNTFLGILFSSILCTCPNQRNLFNLIVSVIVGFLTLSGQVVSIRNHLLILVCDVAKWFQVRTAYVSCIVHPSGGEI